MTQASVNIAQQFKDGGVVPADLTGQNTVSKKYVDDQLVIRDKNIAAAAGAAGAAQSDIDNHEMSTTAHPAQNITYSGLVTGGNVKQAIDNTNTKMNQDINAANRRIDNIVAQSGNDNTEIVDARGGYAALGARLNATDANIRGVAYNVKYPLAPLAAAVGDGITDNGNVINDIISACALNGGGVVLIPPGIYATSKTIVVKPGVQLFIENGATIKPIADVNVIQVKPNSKLIGGAIDCTAVNGFSKAAIYLDGADKFGELGTFESTLIQSVSLSNNEKYTGSAIKIYCATKDQYAMFVKFSNIYIRSFDKGVDLQCDPNDKTQGSWINGNTFDDIVVLGCHTAFYLKGLDPMYCVGGNIFTNIVVQPFYWYSDRAIWVHGDDNYFQGFIWDWSTDRQTIAFEIDGGGRNIIKTNINRINSTLFIDKGYSTVIEGPLDKSYTVDPIPGLSIRSFNGNQDDFLAYAYDRYTVTPSTAPTGGSIRNIFLPEGGYVAIWNTTVPSVSIEIDMTSDPIVTLQTIGIIFNWSSIPQSVKFEAYVSGAYQTIFETSNNYSNVINYSAFVNSVSKLRVTLGNAPSGIEVARFFAQNAAAFGKSWVSSGGGSLYGDLKFPYSNIGPILTSPDGSRWRLGVNNSGSSTWTKI